MKKRYVLAALAVMTVLAGCGDNASQQKNTDNTTQESTAEDDLTAADPDEDGEEDLSILRSSFSHGLCR